ncbi:transketolase [Amycolatopsis orientalis]|uniref:Transketolase n=1 Tax=Amycolatopsis orientalis TaxID=31958 RepID=A0A193BUS6_AMYOR|nr:transketolase [Amycolatopsis orientalis]ANN15933.1 transketolase [Amycolatopsis orientalis]
MIPLSSRKEIVEELSWSALDHRAVDTARVLAMDAVNRAGSGHPGTAMSLAPAAHVLFQAVMRHDPGQPDWSGRDRFVLSAGHACLSQYIQLYLTGYGLALADIEAYRTWGCVTPGHPEFGLTAGVETTTGPLGQGAAIAVGMAMAARYERGLFDPDTEPGESVFDHTIWAMASDGDLQEGVYLEATSLAGHQKLGDLVVIYDDNRICNDGETLASWSENVVARHEACGWHVREVGPAPSGDIDPRELFAALTEAKSVRDRPSLIVLRTTIGWPAPTVGGTSTAHGTPFSADELAATKRLLGFDPDRHFNVDAEVLEHTRRARERGRAMRRSWEQRFEQWRQDQPRRAQEFDRVQARRLPGRWHTEMPIFEPGQDIPTRVASGRVIAALGGVLPELWGGAADVAASMNTTIDDGSHFLPAGSPLTGADPYGRTVSFGVREHAMAAIMNGVALHGGTKIYGGTYLVFADYMRPALRMAAMMGLPVVHLWSHDSIGVGENGMTHQPIEQLAGLRAMPGFKVVRPADANETALVWQEVLRRQFEDPAPHGIALTRQPTPVLPFDPDAARGGYVAREASEDPEVILIATGSEVQIALLAREILESEGTPARVVSMPCVEWFDEQPAEYRESVLPSAVRARVAIEAAATLSWHRFVGDAGRIIGIDRFGECGPYEVLYRHFGLTPEAVVANARESIEAARVHTTI